MPITAHEDRMKKIGVVLIVFLISVSITGAALYMNDVLIPEPGSAGFPEGKTAEPAALGEEKQGSISSTVYFYANGQRIAKQERYSNGTERMFYFHNDHLGSATLITDENGNVVEEKKYSPFGIELAGNSKIGYNSKELDKDTDLNYYGARYYASEFGRFITPDTVKGKLTNPQSLNLYAYTLNNPLKYVDPSGNQQKKALALRASLDSDRGERLDTSKMKFNYFVMLDSQL